MLDAKEYVRANGFPCPFCGSDNIESGSDTDIESGIVTIPVSCNSCGNDWDEEYRLVGYSYFEGQAKLEEIDDPRPERDRLREALEKIANMVKDGDPDPEATDACGEETTVELEIDEAFSTAANCIDIARAALGRGENGLRVCIRVGKEDGELIASAPRLAEQVRILREALIGMFNQEGMLRAGRSESQTATSQRARAALEATKEP